MYFGRVLLVTNTVDICKYRTVLTRCTVFLSKRTEGTNLSGLTDDIFFNIFVFIPCQLLESFHSLSFIVSSSTPHALTFSLITSIYFFFGSFSPISWYCVITTLILLNYYFFSRPTFKTASINSLLFFSPYWSSI